MTERGYTISGKDWKDIVDSISWAVSNDETRESLQHIDVKESSDEIRFRTTDGHVLVEKTYTHYRTHETPRTYAVDGKVLKQKFAAKNEVGFLFNEKVQFQVAGGEIQDATYSGTMPDLDKVIPEYMPGRFFVFDADQMYSVMTALTAFHKNMKSRTFMCVISFIPSDKNNGNRIRISAECDGIKSIFIIPGLAGCKDMKSFSIGIDVRYAAIACKLFKGGDMRLTAGKDNNHLMLFSTERPIDCRAYVMPLRIDN